MSGNYCIMYFTIDSFSLSTTVKILQILQLSQSVISVLVKLFYYSKRNWPWNDLVYMYSKMNFSSFTISWIRISEIWFWFLWLFRVFVRAKKFSTAAINTLRRNREQMSRFPRSYKTNFSIFLRAFVNYRRMDRTKSQVGLLFLFWSSPRLLFLHKITLRVSCQWMIHLIWVSFFGPLSFCCEPYSWRFLY